MNTPWRNNLLVLTFLAGILLTPAAALAEANVGRHLSEHVERETRAELARQPAYAQAGADERKRLETRIRHATVLRVMEQAMTPMQQRVSAKLQAVLTQAIGIALPDGDKRLADIQRHFLPELYLYINRKEEASALYGLYEVTEGDNHGLTLETIIEQVVHTDTAMTEIDVETIFRRIAPLVTPPLNPTEIIRLRNYTACGLLSIH